MPPNSELDEQPEKEQVLSLGQDDACTISGLTDPEDEHRPAAEKPIARPGPSLQDGRQVGLRLGLSFGLLIAILLGTAYLALNHMQRLYAGLDVTLNESMLELQLAQDGLRYSSENSRITMQVFLVRQKDVIDQLLARRAENTRKISAILPVLESHCASEQEKRLLETVKETRTVYVDSYQQALRLLLTEKNREAATEVMVQQTTPALFRYHAAWDEFVRFQFDEVENVGKRGEEHHATARRLMLALDLMVALLTVGIAIIATRKVALLMAARIQVEEKV